MDRQQSSSFDFRCLNIESSEFMARFDIRASKIESRWGETSASKIESRWSPNHLDSRLGGRQNHLDSIIPSPSRIRYLSTKWPSKIKATWFWRHVTSILRRFDIYRQLISICLIIEVSCVSSSRKGIQFLLVPLGLSVSYYWFPSRREPRSPNLKSRKRESLRNSWGIPGECTT